MKAEFHGLLVLDKPTGITSRDVVNRVQSWFPRRTKIGHTGTLDPLATGVLVVCIGQATRLAEYVQDLDKTYRTTLIFGARSDTDDADGTMTPVEDVVAIPESVIRESLKEFTGVIEQAPPAYSAVKIDGKRAHDLARKGHEVAPEARPVRIDRIDLQRYSWPELDLEIHCGKGTYIRSLARDLGERLHVGAYVKHLRRSRVGPFLADQGISMDWDTTTARARMLPVAAAIPHFPSLCLEEDQVRRLRLGQFIPMPVEPNDLPHALFDESGALVGIGRIDAKRLLRPDKTFTLNSHFPST